MIFAFREGGKAAAFAGVLSAGIGAVFARTFEEARKVFVEGPQQKAAVIAHPQKRHCGPFQPEHTNPGRISAGQKFRTSVRRLTRNPSAAFSGRIGYKPAKSLSQTVWIAFHARSGCRIPSVSTRIRSCGSRQNAVPIPIESVGIMPPFRIYILFFEIMHYLCRRISIDRTSVRFN